MEAEFIPIIKFLIKETPVGHLKSTIDNLKIILGVEITETPEILAELRVYEESHLRQVNVNNEKVIVSDLNRGSDEFYYDQNKNLKYAVNPLNENIEKIENFQYEKSQFHSKLKEQLDNYIDKNYKPSITASNIFKRSENHYSLLISVHNYNFKNFWSGEWLGFWDISIVDGSLEVKGSLKISTYYFEEGNVQFKSTKEFSEKLNYDSLSLDSIEDIIKFIEESENTIQNEMENIYDQLSETYIKPLRRRIPFTGQKMNWSLNQINLSREK